MFFQLFEQVTKEGIVCSDLKEKQRIGTYYEIKQKIKNKKTNKTKV